MDKIIFYIRHVLQNKTIYRLLFNYKVKQYQTLIKGRVLDLAGGGEASYHQFISKTADLITTDYIQKPGVDMVVDINERLPFDDNTFDTVLFFNALYIIKDPVFSLGEIRRILVPGGNLYIASPFISNEMPSPHDYRRFTGEGIIDILYKAGFNNEKIERFGERFSVAIYAIEPFLFFRFIKAFVFVLALFLDKLIPTKIKTIHPMPLGYFVSVSNNKE